VRSDPAKLIKPSSSKTQRRSRRVRGPSHSRPLAALTDKAADHAIMDMNRKDIIGVQAIGHVLKAFDDPPHDWGDRTA
jgi:hypothetical protein